MWFFFSFFREAHLTFLNGYKLIKGILSSVHKLTASMNTVIDETIRVDQIWSSQMKRGTAEACSSGYSAYLCMKSWPPSAPHTQNVTLVRRRLDQELSVMPGYIVSWKPAWTMRETTKQTWSTVYFHPCKVTLAPPPYIHLSLSRSHPFCLCWGSFENLCCCPHIPFEMA